MRFFFPFILVSIISCYAQYSAVKVTNYDRSVYYSETTIEVDRSKLPPPPKWIDPRLNSTEGRNKIIEEAFKKALLFICQCRENLVLGTALRLSIWYDEEIERELGAGSSQRHLIKPPFPEWTLYPTNCDSASILYTSFKKLAGFAYKTTDEYGYIFNDYPLDFIKSLNPDGYRSLKVIKINYSIIQKRANNLSRSIINGKYEELPEGDYIVFSKINGLYTQDLNPELDLPPISDVHLGQMMKVKIPPNWKPSRLGPWIRHQNSRAQESFTTDIEIFPLLFERKELFIPSEIGLSSPWATTPVEAVTLLILHELAHLEQYILSNAKTRLYKQHKEMDKDEDTAWYFVSSLLRCK